MTTYAVAREVPEGCDYLTAGKRYEVSSFDDKNFHIFDDESDQRWGAWSECDHLNRKDWHLVKTDAEGWAEWKPSKGGESPPDWQDGWEWEFLSSEGRWTDLPLGGLPFWSVEDTYRYRPRAIAETAQVEPAQPECEHPNADDYRNRAERAEAELAELREKFRLSENQHYEMVFDNFAELDKCRARIRKLEALVCDALLEGDDV